MIAAGNRQQKSISPGRLSHLRRCLFAAAVALLACGLPLRGAADPGPAGGPWREEPRYVALFAPGDGRTSYRAYVTPRPIEAVLLSLETDSSLLHPPGAWRAETLSTTDAFGVSGRYNHWSLALLYGGTAVRVARGPRADGDRVVESWRLFSPYPDPALAQLERGTLLLVETVAPL